MDFPVFIKDNTVAFNTNLIKPNGLQYQISPDTLYTPSGFMIPLNYETMALIDLLEYGFDEYTVAPSDTSSNIIINHRGSVHEAYVREGIVGVDIINRRILLSDSCYIKAVYTECEMMGQMAARLGKSLEHIVEIYCKATPRFKAKYVFMKIDDIAKKLNEMDYRFKFPTQNKINFKI